ncbi:hypothetical protein Dsin_032477 [Dipteronia sinensis]|uniref:RING-type domain-containing protein n=1 Tax=Dipteronia sinensis TaxID=43782 RepID=A0AAE0DT41_9ROSI|nr:hypothetical protein Dsin_032477 [Dipteronia sinensis]
MCTENRNEFLFFVVLLYGGLVLLFNVHVYVLRLVIPGFNEMWQKSNITRYDPRRLNQMLVKKFFSYRGDIEHAGSKTSTAKGSICVVCWEKFKDEDNCAILFDCHHLYHRHCITVWAFTRSYCPACRFLNSHDKVQYVNQMRLVGPLPST